MKQGHIITIIVLILIVVGVTALVKYPGKPGALDGFAQCLADKGALFYGAFWCPHCQTQKSMFGRSASKLPYIECSTPDGNSQTQVCIDKGITTYPTWFFADGTKLVGEVPLATLAEKTGCTLPQ